MVKKFLKFGGNEIEKKKIYSSKYPVAIGNVDINKIIISDAPAYGKYKKLLLSFSLDTKMMKN